MELQTILFYIFSGLLLLAAICVVTAKNPVHAALYLIFSFFSAASLWILIQAEFLALILMFVYVGAVMVLFLFVVMMINLDLATIKAGFKKHLTIAIPIGVLIVLEMGAVLYQHFKTFQEQPQSNLGLIATLGRILYTDYLLAFELAAMILLVAMVAAIALTYRKRKDVTYTSATRALDASKKTRLNIIEKVQK